MGGRVVLRPIKGLADMFEGIGWEATFDKMNG